MSVALKRFAVYVRVVLVVVVLAGVALVLAKNRGNSVAVWFFWLTDAAEPVNVVWLMLWTAAGTLVTWWAVALGWRLWRDVREMKRLRALNGVNRQLAERAKELNQRERRIDEKLRRAITNDEQLGE
jgi:hypothetical protein